MRATLLAALAASLLCAAGTAWAQGNPNADQIINSLKPSGPLTSGTRGIRPVAPPSGATTATPATPAAAAAPAAKPAPAATEAAAGAPSVNLTVQFQTGSSQLTPQAMQALDELGKALTSAALSSYRFRIAGHTDTVGSAPLNKALSDQRAAAVASYLESKFGVAAARLETVGMGESQLLVQTPPQTPEPRNRRVQVINIGT
jgi:outer membrane protein OmpA-like peptidoglycan-associated protein